MTRFDILFRKLPFLILLCRCVLSIGSSFFDPIDYGAAMKCNCLSTSAYFTGAQMIFQIANPIADLVLFSRFLGPRGGRGFLAWTIPMEGALQMIVTVALYLYAVHSLKPEDEMVRIEKLQSGIVMMVVSSFLGFLSAVLTFWYFHFFRMARASAVYEPLESSLELEKSITDGILDDDSNGGNGVTKGALSTAYRLQETWGPRQRHQRQNPNNMVESKSHASPVGFFLILL